MPALNPEALLGFLHQMPKVELHCHLLGTVQRQTLLDWSRRAGMPLSEAEIEAFYVRGEKPVGVLRVLRAQEQLLHRSATRSCSTGSAHPPAASGSSTWPRSGAGGRCASWPHTNDGRRFYLATFSARNSRRCAESSARSASYMALARSSVFGPSESINEAMRMR